MRITFIREALSLQTIANARILLVECDDLTREARLIQARRQPELANHSMKGWSRYLHQEAMEADIEILNTGKTTLAESVARIVSYLQP